MIKPYLQPARRYQNHHLDSTRWEPYIPRDDDIVISNAYKSGSTWTLAIVRELIAHAMRQAGISDPDLLPDVYYEACPWPDLRIRGSVYDLYAKIEAQQHRRFFKTHLSVDGLSFYAQVKYLILDI